MKTRFQQRVEGAAELAFLHRAWAHVACGWIAKIPDLSIKQLLARHAYEDLELAHKLSGVVFAATRRPAEQQLIPRGAIEVMKAIDAAPNADAMLIAAYGVARRHLFFAHRELAVSFDPVLDANLAAIAASALENLRRTLEDGAAILAARLDAGADDVAEEIERRFQARNTEERAPAVVWKPLDRAPIAARPEHMIRGVPGAMRLVPIDSGRDRDGLALYLHNAINGEYTTMELCARSNYEHPDLPPAFHLQLARQAADEARHARALELRLERLGHSYGDHPIYTLTYDGYYAFSPCDPGGKRELLWRLLARGSIDEALALDDFAFQIQRREHLGQLELADLFRALLADETFHVESAMRWSRHLCGGDEARVFEEREAANAFVNTMLEARRRAYAADHPEAVRAERAHRVCLEAAEIRDPLPFARTLNVPLRRAAGFTDRDLQQVVAWEYARP